LQVSTNPHEILRCVPCPSGRRALRSTLLRMTPIRLATGQAIVLLCIGVIFLLCSAPLLLLAQNKTEVIDGKRYYIHTVMKGETLYAISRKYGVEIRDIALENPLTISGLKTGNVIKIPVSVKSEKTARPLDGKYIFHTLQYGETFYSLSKQFLVSIDDIKSANPELVNGLKSGMTIRIPLAIQIVADTMFANDTISSHHSPLTNIQSDSLTFRDVYNVGLMLPFYLAMNDSIARNKENYELDKIYALSEIALEFYEGALIAVDSLKKQGLSVRLFVYDTKKDTNEVIRLLQQEESLFMNMDLIIGPFYRSNLSIVVNFPKPDKQRINTSRHSSANLQIFKFSNHPHIVSPFIITNDILRGNPHLSKATSCFETHVEKIAIYIARKYISRNNPDGNKNIIVVYNEFPDLSDEDANGRGLDEKMLSEIFKNKLLSAAYHPLGYDPRPSVRDRDTMETAPPPAPPPKGGENLRAETPTSSSVLHPFLSLKQIAYNERGMEAIEEVLSIPDTNVIVIPSRDQVFVSKLISKLNNLKDDYDMILFGLPVWKNFANIEIEYLHNLKVHIASSSYIDYESEEVKSFVKQYFGRYHTFPGNYAFQGFDIVYYYLNTLKNYGYNFQTHLPEITNAGLQTSYEYFKTGVEDGYENKKVFILKYEDYELKLVSGDW